MFKLTFIFIAINHFNCYIYFLINYYQFKINMGKINAIINSKYIATNFYR